MIKKAKKLTRDEIDHRVRLLSIQRWIENFKKSGGELWLDDEILCSYTPQGPSQHQIMRFIYDNTEDLKAVLKGQIYS